METVKTLIIRFRNKISQAELAMFRGAVIKMTEGTNILFHNHAGEHDYRYSYPLIQYHRIGGCASIVCIGQGTDAIGEFFANFRSKANIGENETDLVIDNVNAMQTNVGIWDTMFSYSVRKWIPLNTSNYNRYKEMDSLAERSGFLEKIFIGNVLSFAKGMGIHLDDRIKCSITNLEELRLIEYKGIKFSAFDIRLKSNISLPDYIGLGKGASLGYGTLTRIKEK